MENESLTSSHRQKAILEALMNHVPDEELARVVLDQLYGVARKLVDNCPLHDVLASGGDPRTLEELLRKSRQRNSVELLIEVCFDKQDGNESVVQAYFLAEVERGFDVVAKSFISTSDPRVVTELQGRKERVSQLLEPGIRELVEKLAANPDRRPRRPPGLKKKETTERLLRRSLLR